MSESPQPPPNTHATGVSHLPAHATVSRRGARSGERRAPKAPVPVGTVSFMLTDIEDSTTMWRTNPQNMLVAVQRHREIVDEGMTRYGGYLPRDQGEGDSVFGVFDRATNAVSAAVAIQSALEAEPWPPGTNVRIRIGIHIGEAEVREGNYFGSAVSRTARIRSLAWGGQVLLSQAAMAMARDNLPQGTTLRDLGTQPLKGFDTPEQVFQLVHPEIESDFPPLRARDFAPNNLPVPLTTFVGRAEEMSVVKDLLTRSRLVTLTGTGGSGKTRLAIEAAREALSEFEDGVHVVDLANITDPNLVLSTITHSMSIYEHPTQTTFENLVQSLSDKKFLLVLDNFERVLDAAPMVSDLLMACPELTVLVTSRSSLRVGGEQEYSLPPLRLPDTEGSLELIRANESVRLFVERARAASFEFTLDESTAPMVASICAQLDGLPLAIELAAAHVKLLPLEMLLARLDSRLDVLKGGARDLPERQQTLRNLIDWDYSMLSESHQALFRRLAVFSGGFTLEAATEVVGSDDVNVLDGIEGLIDGSLVRHGQWDKGHRFWMLQTIRDYADDALQKNNERDPMRARHASYYVALALEAEANIRGPDQVEWLDRLELEHDNIRAALAWAHEQTDPTAELQLVAAMTAFWSPRGHIGEGSSWIRAALERSADMTTAERAHVLSGAALVDRARGDYDAAINLLKESLELRRELGDDDGVATTYKDLANVEFDQGNIEAAGKLYEETLERFKKLNNESGISQLLNNMGVIAQAAGRPDQALERYRQSYELFTKLGDKQGLARSLMNQGSAHREAGDVAHAIELLKDSLLLWRELEDYWDATDCVEDMAAALCEARAHKEAVTLYGYADALRDDIGAPRPPFERESYEKRVASLRDELGNEGFGAAWKTGAGMDLEEAVDFAIGISPPQG